MKQSFPINVGIKFHKSILRQWRW